MLLPEPTQFLLPALALELELERLRLAQELLLASLRLPLERLPS